MLNLVATTDNSWGPWAACHLSEILVDHAHCEKKAAGTAMNLLFRYPHVRPLQEPLAALAREELTHFEIVLGELRRIGVEFVPQKPGPYGQKVHRVIRDTEPEKLLDTLLCCSVIEARSCERLSLLSDSFEDVKLKDVYKDLLASEARHHKVYVELARDICGSDFEGRILEVYSHEAKVLSRSPDLPRLHAGAGFVN